MIFDTYIYEDDKELPVRVTYNFSPGRKAKTYGPMEDCCPEEPGEIEIESVKVWFIDIYSSLSPEEKEQIEDEALEHAVNAAIDLAEKNDANEADRAGDEQRELQHWDEIQ